MSGAPAARRAGAGDMPAVLALRHAVFCDEQGVPPELEHDAHDATALHMILERDGAVLATCRLLRDGDAVKLGRMAVRRARRGEGLGAELLAAAHAEAAALGATRVRIHAQLSARGFWERGGYVAHGPEFEEAGMPHVAMERPLP